MKSFAFFLASLSFVAQASAGGPDFNSTLVDILNSVWYSIDSMPSPSGSDNVTVVGFTDCKYECEDKTKTPVPRPGHVPTSDGCSIGPIPIPRVMLPDPRIEDCCNQHDICYDTCNSVKSDCDTAFKNCMAAVCGDRQFCNWVADKFYQAVFWAGCPSYLIAQSKACICV